MLCERPADERLRRRAHIGVAVDTVAQSLWGYKFGYELLMLNGMLTFAGLWMSGWASDGKDYNVAQNMIDNVK